MGARIGKAIKTASRRPAALADRALREYMGNGSVSTVCPKCREHPEIKTTPGGERTVVRCRCGYVKNMEINL